MSKILFLDTETNGLPRDFKAPYTDTRNWPRIVQLAWAVHDADGQKVKERSFIIRPDNWMIGAETSNIHGITTERAKADGVPLAGVIDALEVDLIGCDFVICHNVGFDRNVVLSEYVRLSENYDSNVWASSTLYPRIRHYCTMEMTTNILRLPGKKGAFKWPKLDELYFFLFNRSVPGREQFHDAMVDVRATSECFFKLKQIKQGTKPKPSAYGHMESVFMEEEGGWMSEGGETMYYNHLQVWSHFNEKYGTHT